MNIIHSIYSKICEKAITNGGPKGSNFRWKNAIHENIKLHNTDEFVTLNKLQIILRNLYSKFIYTIDDLYQLGDSIVPPPQNYQHYLDGKINDDCDGFHSALYHIIYNNGIECYLMTANAIGSGHCVLLMQYNYQGRVVDYMQIYGAFDTIKEAIEDYNTAYSKKYKTGKVVYNGFISYDYDKGEFKAVKLLK